MERRYRPELSSCHPTIETPLRESLRDDEQFIFGLTTTDRILRRDTRLVVTSERLLIVYSGFVDVRVQDIVLRDIESVRTDRSGPGLPTLVIHTARSTERFDIKTLPTEFIEIQGEYTRLPVRDGHSDHSGRNRGANRRVMKLTRG